jgi:hypothetical protein
MAGSIEQRACARKSCQIPLKFAVQKSDKYFDATMFNISDEGIYMEARQKLSPGDDIWIKMMDNEDVGSGKRFLEIKEATVIWSALFKKDNGSFYGAGINMGVTDILGRTQVSPDIEYHCDMCGKRVKTKEFQKRIDCVCLCSVCSEYLNSFPESLRKRCIERFLLGNAL